ncbi:hypothetical protein Tcan_04289 [Toxocara canis]|uniref:Uncharacterized protein n=1 Tax=Toxocara canis TaxID=6265 RepID=A0A0B2VV06_TOXCA|nr:hypothetical protein Tcan_04289 [Toxocara canis]
MSSTENVTTPTTSPADCFRCNVRGKVSIRVGAKAGWDQLFVVTVRTYNSLKFSSNSLHLLRTLIVGNPFRTHRAKPGGFFHIGKVAMKLTSEAFRNAVLHDSAIQ